MSRQKVLELVEAAREGMVPASRNSSSADVLNAYFTLTKSGISYVLERVQSEEDREFNRAAIITALLDLLAFAEGKVN